MPLVQGPSPLGKPGSETRPVHGAPAAPDPEQQQQQPPDAGMEHPSMLPRVAAAETAGHAVMAAAPAASEPAEVTPPLQPAAMPEGMLPSAGGSGDQRMPLSFANPADEQRLVQQLSAKLVPLDANMLTVSSEDSKASKSRCTSARHSVGPRRGSRSCDPSPRDSVHMRLYSKASDARKKAAAKTKMADVEMSASVQAHKTKMSWISSEMMRGRNSGPFDNYGEMLYAEGLEAAAMRRSKV
eukprot:365441-Chlamydomonas_euryale.AAC.3